MGLKQEFGFYPPEKANDGREFRWTGSTGGMTLKIEKAIMVIPLLASHPDLQKYPVMVDIYLVKQFFRKKRLIQKIMLRHHIWQSIVLSIPEEVGNEVIVLFKVSRTWNPLKTIKTADPRNLGVAVGRVEFRDLK